MFGTVYRQSLKLAKCMLIANRKKWIAQYHSVSETPLKTHEALKDHDVQGVSIALSEVRVDK